MFDALRAAIDGLEVPAEGTALADVLALADRLDARIAEALGEFDAADGWALDGATSLAAWLRHHGRRPGADAHRSARTAKLLHRLPVTSAAYRDGRLSGGQVAAIVANVTERTVDRFAEHEADVVPVLAPLPAADVAIAMQVWRARAEAMLDDAERPEDVRELHLSPSLDRRWHGRFTLDELGGAVVGAALRLAESPDVEGEPERSKARRRGDALIDICRHFLDHQRTGSGGRHRPHVNVVIGVDDLAAGRHGRVVDGGPLSCRTVESLLCDCGLHRVVAEGRSSILDYGRTSYTVPVNLFNALVLRDEHCRHPGCDRPASWCEAHHVVHWLRGGETKLSNLVLKCSRHHHLGHEPGWSEILSEDGTLVVTDPSGRRSTSHPPGLLRFARAS